MPFSTRSHPRSAASNSGFLRSRGPVLNVQLRERKVLWVSGRETRSEPQGRRRDQAISLRERVPSAGELPSPFAGRPSFDLAQGRDAQPREQSTRRLVLVEPQSAYRLFDVDRARVNGVSARAERPQPSGRFRPAV